jgi:hypothetical protein
MDLDLYDCRHCNTFGVLPTSDGKCPNCRQSLDVEDRQGAHPANWAPCPRRRSLEEERQRKIRQRVIVLCVIVPGILALLASPATYMRFFIKHGKWTGTTWSLSSEDEKHIPEAMNGTAAWAACFLLVGWALVEGGLLTVKPRGVLRVLLRIPLYSFIVVMFGKIVATSFLVFLLSHMGP